MRNNWYSAITTTPTVQPVEQVIIVGAGFSHYAGLPLQSGFTAEILRATRFLKGPSKRITDFLCTFVRDDFHPQKRDSWPALEDLFTCIDLSANTGHHLGRDYCPSQLRTVRRALIARIIRMLRQSYERASKNPDERWLRLQRLLANVDPTTTAFLSLNWDTVAETRMLELRPGLALDYGPGFTPAEFPDHGSKIRAHRPPRNVPALRIAKIHGSVNWLYCDNCRHVFWFPPDETIRIADQLLSTDEWKTIAPRAPANAKRQWTCAYCDDVTLSTRIATFSYRKALDFPMFQHSWTRAERLLRGARRWVFIGYSLPAADFEFKYLLKRTELSHPEPLDVVLVTGGKGANAARTTYEGFFGDRLNARRFPRGLTKNAVDFLTTRRRL